MQLEIEVISSLADVAPEPWDALCAPDDPFMEHGFLSLLEESGSVGTARSGWLPRHVLVRRGGELVAALPLYLKDHSYGEFIFDFGWAQAALRAGIAYYPKLVCAVPLTPAGGTRLLVRPDEREALSSVLIAAAQEVARRERASSVHVLFCRADECEQLAALGLHPRHSTQYHLLNPGLFRSFDDFLGALRNASRKQVRKERERAQSYGLTLSMRPFAELAARDVAAMWTFYRRTIANHGSEPYLRRGFFEGLGRHAHAFAAMAHDGDEPVAGALFFYKGGALFGRYWGALAEVPFLHFNVCFYKGIEEAIERRLGGFEPGAGGEHKVARGFEPTVTHSSHFLADRRLRDAIARHLIAERAAVDEHVSEAEPVLRR